MEKMAELHAGRSVVSLDPNAQSLNKEDLKFPVSTQTARPNPLELPAINHESRKPSPEIPKPESFSLKSRKPPKS